MSFLDFKTKNLPADLASGAVGALIAIPDAIASALLAGVNPTYAFNALMTGTPIGSLFSSSHFMSIGLTSAMMLAGVHDHVKEQLYRTETTESIPEDALYMATSTVGESTRAAVAAAEEWLAKEAAALNKQKDNWDINRPIIGFRRSFHDPVHTRRIKTKAA